MSFQEFNSPFTGQIDPDMIWYTDDDGMRWSVPRGHRFWDIYEQWLSDGNKPTPAD